MTNNLGTWDRWLRIAAGAFLFSLLFWGPQTSWGWLGLILAMTGLVGHCPIYVMLGIKTCPRNGGKSSFRSS